MVRHKVNRVLDALPEEAGLPEMDFLASVSVRASELRVCTILHEEALMSDLSSLVFPLYNDRRNNMTVILLQQRDMYPSPAKYLHQFLMFLAPPAFKS